MLHCDRVQVSDSLPVARPYHVELWPRRAYRGLPSSEGSRNANTIQGVRALHFNLPIAARSGVAARSECPDADFPLTRLCCGRAGIAFGDIRNGPLPS